MIFLINLQNLFTDKIHFRAPSIDLSRIGKETIISGKYLTFPSPCGQNCSYTINIEGPGFNCTDALPSQFQQTVNMSYPMPNREPYNWTLYAAISSEVSSDPAQGEGGYTFDVQWANKDAELEQPTDVHNISCLAYKANYTLDISYHNGLATIIAQQRLLDVLNSSYQGDDYSYNPETPKGVNPNTSEYDFIINSTSCENAWLIEDLYKRSTLLAVRDTLVDALIGIIGVPGKFLSSYSISTSGTGRIGRLSPSPSSLLQLFLVILSLQRYGEILAWKH